MLKGAKLKFILNASGELEILKKRKPVSEVPKRMSERRPEEGSDWRISYEAPREMARIFECGEFVTMKAVALASEEMHDDCSEREVSQDGDCHWTKSNEAPEKDKVVRLQLESSYQKRLQRT